MGAPKLHNTTSTDTRLISAAFKEPLREVSRPFEATQGRGRYRPLDVARGLAISLMILSHTVMALLSKSAIPEWGLVPIHLITKLSSSLFFVIFGLGIRLLLIQYCGTERWSEKRNHMIGTAIEIFIWYKILTVVQLYGSRSPQEVFNHLVFKEFPDFVEVLSFYSIALLWVPFVLPLWRYIPFLLKPFLIVGLFWAGNTLHMQYDFGGWDVIKTLLVEFDGRYTFGQFQRGAFVLLGFWLGDIMSVMRNRYHSEKYFGLVLLAFSALFIGGFHYVVQGDYLPAFDRIANNVGKHPPSLEFVTFSLGSALALFAFIHLTSRLFKKLSKWLYWPWEVVGRRSLVVFNFHILFIFLILRNVLDWRNQLSYDQVLVCAAGVFILSIALVKCLDWFGERTEWEKK